VQIPFNPAKQLPKADYLAPVAPQTWHFRQSVDYSVTANKAVLDYASRQRQHLLHNIWLMGKKAIDRGNRDSWTTTPKVLEAATAGGAKFMKGSGGAKEFERFFHDPVKRDPRGYILPANRPDFLTATKFVNVLLGTGVKVHLATTDFQVAGKKYPKGSYVVKCNQAFRAHVLDMFEPQDHPNDFAYPGGPPTPPYDAAGWTLAFQMGVKFERLLEGFDGPFEEIKVPMPPPAAKVADTEGAVGFFLGTRTNDAFRAVNRLLKAGEEVRRLQEPIVVQGVTHPAGMFFVMRKPTTLPLLEKIAAELGTPFVGSPTAPGKQAVTLRPVRVGLWDKPGGSMPSGWTRWLLERFEFPFQVVMVQDLDKGGLRDKFDVLIFVDDLYFGKGGPSATTVGQLRKFLDNGGTILTIGGATGLAEEFALPVTNHLVSVDKDGKERGLPREKFYVPASVLRMRVESKHPLAWGMTDEVDVMFAASPTFRLPAGSPKELTRIAWFDSKTPLRSGWALGQEYLENGIAIVDAKVGSGRLVLFGPHILYRGQPHGTFKFLFNGIVRAGAKE
jgi:hypothetical protein